MCSGGDPHHVASLAVASKQSSFLSLPSFGLAGMHRHVRLNFIIVMSGLLLFNEYMLNIKLYVMDAKKCLYQEHYLHLFLLKHFYF